MTGSAPSASSDSKRGAGVQVAAAALAVLEREQHLRHGDLVLLQQLLVGVRESDLSHGGGGLALLQPQRTAWSPSWRRPRAMAPGGHQDDLLAALAQAQQILDQGLEPGAVDASAVPDRRAAPSRPSRPRAGLCRGETGSGARGVHDGKLYAFKLPLPQPDRSPYTYRRRMKTRVACVSRDYEPVAGQWYENLEEEEKFRVLSVDEDDELVEIEYLDGDIEEIDLDTWHEMDLDCIEEPEGWSESDEEEEDEEDEDERRGRGR